jgi:O-antigen/teichoic acid export membrane protein
MQKKFISNLILMVFLNLLVKPFAIFGIDANVQNSVGAKSYGLYFSLLTLTVLFNILMDVGINNFTTKNISQYPHIVSRYMGKLLSFRLILFSIYAIVVGGLAVTLGYRGHELTILLFLIVNQFLVTLIAYFRSHFAGFLLFKTDAVISVLDRIFLILFCGLLLIASSDTGEFKIEWFVWMQTVCYGLTALVAFYLVIKLIGKPKISWHWTFSKAIVKKSFPYALLFLLMMIYTRVDSIMLQRIHSNGSYEAGIYAQGFRLLDAFFQFGMIFSGLLFPIFSRLLHTQKSILPLLRTSGNLLIGGSILLIVFCYFNSEFLISLIYDHNIEESLPSFRWLMLSFLGISCSLIFGTLLTANGNLRILIIYSLAAIVLNMGMNFYLIPQFGATGAAFTAFCTQSFIALIQFIYCRKEFQFRFCWEWIVRYFLFVGFVIAIFLLIPTLEMGPISILIELLLGVISLFIFKMIDVRTLIFQFNSEK